jgi:haloalkane dehalogenase
MAFLHVELFSYREAWRRKPSPDRASFLAWVQAQIDGTPAGSIEVVSFCMNEAGTDRRAPYDFCCVFRYADRAALEATLAAIAGSDWYRYFDQVNLAGPALSPPAMHRIWVALEGPTTT